MVQAGVSAPGQPQSVQRALCANPAPVRVRLARAQFLVLSAAVPGNEPPPQSTPSPRPWFLMLFCKTAPTRKPGVPGEMAGSRAGAGDL